MGEDAIIEKYSGLIYKIAKRFYGVELSDLYQSGTIGLIKAYRNYNPNLGSSFTDYAYLHIYGEMYEFVNKSRDIKLSKAYLQLYKQIQIARSKLIDSLNKEPSLEQIASFLKIDESLISEVIALTSNMLSLDEPFNDNISVMDSFGKEEDLDSKILIEDSLSNLEPLEQDVIRIRYFEDLTQMETAQKLGISQVKVSRLETKGKQKIKEYIAS